MPEPLLPRHRTIDECLGPLTMHLKRTQIAYQRYMQEGQPFRRALVLWESNLAMRDLLLAKGYLLPDTLQEAAIEIIAHIDIWAALWQAHREADQPLPDDVFAFENADCFPSEAEAALKAYYVRACESR